MIALVFSGKSLQIKNIVQILKAFEGVSFNYIPPSPGYTMNCQYPQRFFSLSLFIRGLFHAAGGLQQFSTDCPLA